MKLASVIVILAIIFLSFEFITFHSLPTSYLTDKYNINKTAHQNVLDFIQYEDELRVEMSEEERSHMYDVRTLHDNFKAAAYILVIASIPVIIFYGISWISLSVVGVIGIIMALFPSLFFDLFHRIFFPQGNYLFDPGSKLLTLYPEAFFINLFLLSLIIGIVIYGLLKVKF